jgi:hypothetical protein
MITRAMTHENFQLVVGIVALLGVGVVIIRKKLKKKSAAKEEL